VTNPNTGQDEKRLYFGVDRVDKTLWCLNVDKIIADRSAMPSGALCEDTCECNVNGDCPADPPGCTKDAPSACQAYFCDGPWPMSLGSPEPPVDLGGDRNTLNGSPLFAADMPFPNGPRDVLYVPSTGLDCSNGQFYAIDAFTGEKLWTFDPVVNGDGLGGVIWTAPAMSKDRTQLFMTVGDCVQKPQVGELAEALVSLDPITGARQWWHQRRLVDVADLDIGNSPTVVDIDGTGGCHLIVSIDKDSCIYGFPQQADVPQVGDLDFDPLRQPGRRLRCGGRGDLGTHPGGLGGAPVRPAPRRRRERVRHRRLHGRLQVGVELARRELRRGRRGERHVLHAGGDPARRGADGFGDRRAGDAGDDEPQARATRHRRASCRRHAGRRRSGDRRREDLRAGAAGHRGRGGRRDRSRNVSGSAVLPGAAGERHLPRPVSRAVRARRAGQPHRTEGAVRLDGRRVKLGVRGPAAR